MNILRIALVATSLAVGLVVAQLPDAGGSLRGRVLDGRGQPVDGATVVLRAGPSRQQLLTLSGRDGAYSYSTLKPEVDYEVDARHEGLASLTRMLRISSAGEKVGMDLVLGPRIQFQEAGAKSGLDFVLRNGATGHRYQPEIMVAGVAAFDYNNDGCMDIFFVNGATLPELKKAGPEYHNRLYRNNCDLSFTDVTETAGLAGEGYGMGVAAADYDNDGHVDLFVAGLHGSALYRNRGDGRFENVTTSSGLAAANLGWAVSAGWFDYDNDGWLDLFVTHYVSWDPSLDAACSAQGKPFYCHPRVYRGLPNQLFHNNHDGTFTDVSRVSGISASIGKGMGVAFGDFNGDGLTDIFVANDSVPNFLFQNLGGGKFKEVSLSSGVARTADGKAVAGMGADFRDADDDGFDDIVLSAMYYDTFPFFRNHGPPNFFEDETIASGLAGATVKFTGWGLGMYDFDNDGRKDLFFATSHFPGSEPYAGSSAETSNRVLRGIGNAAFEDVSLYAGGALQRSALFHGVAFADFDNDGRVDAVVTALNSPARLLRNTSPGPAHWLALRLVGTRSNRDGLGARVRLTLPNGAVQHNHATTSVGYASSSEPLVRFGLGPYEMVKEIEVRWPGGRVQRVASVKADQLFTITEQ
jgi:hypothetical protein